MARVTEVEVEEIIEVDSSLDLSPFITIANLLVNQSLDDSAIGYSAAYLKEIERWLAAHFTAIRDPRNKEEHAGPVGRQLAIAVGSNGFDSTPYGQQAMAIDTSGTLRRMNEGKSATGGFSFLGSQDTDTTSLSS